MPDKNRLYYLDNLKLLLIMLVIIHHAGQAYGATGGGWFYAYPGERVQSMGLLFRFNASFFMGLFFFISGYFFPASFDRHGACKFIADKLVRFGIPLVFLAFTVLPILAYVKYLHYSHSASFPDFYLHHWLGHAANGSDPYYTFNFGHMWFIEHLLIYAVIFAAIGTLLKKEPAFPLIFVPRDVRLFEIILYIAALGFLTQLVRKTWGFPIDHWIFLLGFIQMEPAHLPQYLSLFVLGVLAYRHSFLESITTPRNMLWFIPGMGIFLITIVQQYIMGRASAFLLWEYREALLCVGMCIGLLALFRTHFNRTGRFVQILVDNAYGAYIFHVPVVVALQYAFDPVHAGAFILFVIVSILSVIGSFSLSFLIRLIPGIRQVI